MMIPYTCKDSAGVLTYLYAPKSREKKSYEDSGFVIDDSERKIRNIFYAHCIISSRLIIMHSFGCLDPIHFSQYDVGDWNAPHHDAKWVQAIPRG